MTDEEFPYLVYQEKYGPLLREIAWAAGSIAGDGDVEGLAWFEEHVTVLLETAKNRMNSDILDHGGGSPLPI